MGDEPRRWIADERSSSDAVALVSATNAFLVRPIGEALGFDAVLASEYELANGRFTGTLAGELNLGPAKVRRVAAWLAERGLAWRDLERCACWADSVNDLPLFEVATDRFAVDPHPRLAEEAERRGWRVLRTGRCG
ncbi:MAG: HAD-IB family phosphatase [Planctomycetota bacterium]